MKTYTFTDHYSIQLSQHQKELLKHQLDIHDIAWNTSWQYVLKNYGYHLDQTTTLPLKEIYNYLMTTIFTERNPMYSYLCKNLDPLIIYNVVLELEQSLYAYLQQDPDWCNINIQDKLLNATCRKISFFYNDRLQTDCSLSINNLQIIVPLLGTVDVITSLTLQDRINLNATYVSKIIRIDIVYYSSSDTTELIIYKTEMVKDDTFIDYPDKIGVWVDYSDPYNIYLSNGTIEETPSYIKSLIDTLRYSKEMEKQINYRSIAQDISARRNYWFMSKIIELANKYKRIYVPSLSRNFSSYENISITPDYSIYFPSWFKFISFLENHIKKIKSSNQVIKIKYNAEINLRCNKCGSLSIPQYKINDTTWICRACKTEHNLYLNAAKNLLLLN